MTNHEHLILVTGGTGKTGRRVAERLTALGHSVRIGSRGGDPPFDWNNPSTWAAALHDVDAAYVAYVPDLAFPGAVETVRSFAATAVEHGVRRLVLLSGRGEPEALAGEAVITAAGAEWTIVRASWFMQNFSEHFLLESVRDGVIAIPAGTVAEPFIDVDDIADVAVAALVEDRHVGMTYEVTGPRLLTFSDVAAELTNAVGRPIEYVDVAPEDYLRAAIAAGVPPEEAGPLADLFTAVLDGRNAHLSDGVQQALGRAPRDFTDYARAAASTGTWDVRVEAGAPR